jgi:septal ring factor EnvC (AmiA/AmiB activator)
MSGRGGEGSGVVSGRRKPPLDAAMPDTKVSWQTIVGAVVIVGLMSAAQWTVSQTEFSSITAQITDLKNRVIILEQEQKELLTRTAHDPVEQKTIDATNAATAKEIDQIQAEITDINRQIAAALIIIDNNSALGKKTLPP